MTRQSGLVFEALLGFCTMHWDTELLGAVSILCSIMFIFEYAGFCYKFLVFLKLWEVSLKAQSSRMCQTTRLLKKTETDIF